MHAIVWYPRRAGKFDWEEVDAGDPALRGYGLFSLFDRPGRPGALRTTPEMPWWILNGEGRNYCWFRVQWLVDAPWDRRVRICGLVTPESFDEFERTGSVPELLSEWSLSGHVTMSPEEWNQERIAGDIPSELHRVVIRFEHDFTLRDQWRDIHDRTLPKLLEFGNPEKVHFVYSLF